MKKLITIFCMSIFIAVLSLSSAQAWDGIVTGNITRIDVGNAGNDAAFRVYLAGFPALCGNNNNWAYLNDTDGNYKVYVSMLIAAKTQGSTVTLYSNRDSNGYCMIGYVISY